MTRINKKIVFKINDEVSLNDYLIGTRNVDGETLNFDVQGLMKVMNAANGISSVSYTFSLNEDIHLSNTGYMTTNSAVLVPKDITSIRLSAFDLNEDDITSLLTTIESNKDSVFLKIKKPSNVNSVSIFKVDSVGTSNAEYITVNVEAYNTLSTLEFEDGVTYTLDYYVFQEVTKTSQLLNDGSTGATPYAEVSDIYSGNAVIKSNYYNIPNTYNYFVRVEKFVFGSVFNEVITDTVVVDNGHDTFDRFDLVVLNIDRTISVIKGVPAAIPSFPELLDPETQALITTISIKANTTSAEGVVDSTVYNENLQEVGGEWNLFAQNNPLSVDFESIEQFSSGSFSIKYTGFGGVRFENSTPVLGSDFSNIRFKAYVPSPAPTVKQEIVVQFWNLLTSRVSYKKIENGICGFDSSLLNTWQEIVISKADMNLSDLSEFTEIIITNNISNTTLYVDEVILQGGLAPTSTTEKTKTSEFINDGADGASTFVEHDELGLVATTNDYNDLLNKPTIKAVQNEYATWALCIADQLNQTSGAFQSVIDASGHPTVDSGYAYFEYLGTTVGDDTDYRKLSEEESMDLVVKTKLSEFINDGENGTSRFVEEADLVFMNEANLIIGGVGATINTVDLLVAKLSGITVDNLSNFKVIKDDVYVFVDKEFSIKNSSFKNDLSFTSLYDKDDLIISIGYDAFLGCTNFKQSLLVLNGLISIQGNVFNGVGVKNFEFLKLDNIATSCFSNNIELVGFNAPLLTSIGIVNTFGGCVNIKNINIPNCTTLGMSLASNGIFSAVTVGTVINIHYSLETVNAGEPDGDLVYAISLGATVNYIYPEAKINEVVDLANPQDIGVVKTFLYDKLGMRNLANTFTSYFRNVNTANRYYTLPNRNGTLTDNVDLATKQDKFTGIANFISKSIDATTLGVSRLFDNGSKFGIGTVEEPTKDITLGNQADREIGVELSSSTITGKDLTISAGTTINYILNANFNSLNQSATNWRTIAYHPNGNIYAIGGGVVYVQYQSTGNFQQTGVANLHGWTDYMAVHPNGNIYTTAYNSGISVQTNATGNFVSLGEAVRAWFGIACHPNGNVYACVYGGDIYMQTNGTGAFVALGIINRAWYGMTISPNGNVYACVSNGDIYMQTNGTGAFVALNQTIRAWYTMCSAPNGNVYATVSDGKIYLQTNGVGAFTYTGHIIPGVWGICSTPTNDIYAVSIDKDIYKQQNDALGTSNLKGGALKLKAGTGKGIGTSRVEFLTGQKTISGTDMQLEKLRGYFDEDGNFNLSDYPNTRDDGANPTNKILGTDEFGNVKMYDLSGGLPAPFLEELVPDTYLPSTTGNFILRGSYFTEDMTIVIEGHTYNYVTFINSNEVRINLTTIATEGTYDLTLNNGTEAIFNDVLQIVNGTVYEPTTNEWTLTNNIADVSKGDSVEITTYNTLHTAKWSKEFDYLKDFDIRFKYGLSPLGAFAGGYNVKQVYLKKVIDDSVVLTIGARFLGGALYIFYTSALDAIRQKTYTIPETSVNLKSFKINYIGGILRLYIDNVLIGSFSDTLLENVYLEINSSKVDVTDIKYIDLSDASGVTIPNYKRISQFVNDSGYITDAEMGSKKRIVDANVTTTFEIDHNLASDFKLTMVADTTFSEINLPKLDETNEITIKLTGAFVPTFPPYWTVKGDTYNGALWNFISIQIHDGNTGTEEATAFITNL